MTWYTFQDWVWTSGPNKGKLKVYNVTGIDNLELEATGAHGYPTEHDALAKPNAFPGVDQEALLAAFSAQAAYPIGGGTAGAQTPTPSATAGAKNAVKKAAGAAKKAVTGDWSGWLLRIGEVVLGIVLLAIGVARITKAVPVATKIATTVGTRGIVK